MTNSGQIPNNIEIGPKQVIIRNVGNTAFEAYTPIELQTGFNNYTDEEKIKVSNLSGVNTGDQDLSGYQTRSEKAQANGYASLGADGKIPSSQIPDLSITEYLGNFTDITTALANSAVNASQKGDWFTVNTDGGKTYIVTSNFPTLIGHVTIIKTPTDVVTSVNGQNGTVALDLDDIPDGATNKAFTIAIETSLKSRANHTGTQSADTVVDGTVNKVLTLDDRTDFRNQIPTGGLAGCKLIGTAGGTTFNINSGNYHIMDRSDINNPVITNVTYAGSTGNADSFLGISDFTYVFLTSAGTISQQLTPPSSADLSSKFYIGKTVHLNASATYTINSIDTRVPAFGAGQVANDDKYDRGPISTSGNTFTFTTTSFTKSSGTGDRLGVNFDDKNSPNDITMAAKTFGAATSLYLKTGAASTFTFTTATGIDSTITDNGNGTTTAVLSNKWSNQYVYSFPGSDVMVVVYGRTAYNNISDAKAGVSTEVKTYHPVLNEGIYLGVMHVRGGGTNFTLLGDGEFTPGIKLYGSIGIAGGGGGGGSQDLQLTYTYSVQPQITTSVALGAIQIKRGSAADTDTIQEWLNGAGALTASMKGDGTFNATEITKAGVVVPTISSTNTLTNKTINGSNNTITNISLTTGVTGTLPIGNGGTGSATQNFVDLTTAQTIAGEKTFTGNIINGYTSFATIYGLSNFLSDGLATIHSTSIGGLYPYSENSNFVIQARCGTAGSIRDIVFITGAPTVGQGNIRMIISRTGNIIIGGVTNTASAILNINSTTQGFLPPRMTTTQRDAITTPATGLMVYNTTTNTIDRYDGTTWDQLVDNKSAQTIAGIKSFTSNIKTNGTSAGGTIHRELANTTARFKDGLTGTETGSNAGSNYRFYSYDDAGNFITEVYTIRRSTGDIGFGVSAPAISAKMEIASTTKGFLPPRMTTTQRDAIGTPAEGLVIYNTTTKVLNFYNGTAWGAV